MNYIISFICICIPTLYLWNNKKTSLPKTSFFAQCTKMQLITLQNFNIQTYFSQFLWFFSLKCWFKGQMISRIHLSLPNAYKLMCFDRNINGNRDAKFLECDYLLVQRCVKLTLVWFKKVFDRQNFRQNALWELNKPVQERFACTRILSVRVAGVVKIVAPSSTRAVPKYNQCCGVFISFWRQFDF